MTDRILAPRDLDSKGQELFRDTLAVIRAREDPAFERVTDVPLLEQYVRDLQMARHALARITKREAEQSGTGWQTLGAQRQQVQHPDVKTMREALRAANDAAKELLLPPRTRKQHEIAAHKPASGGKFGDLQ